MASGGWLQLKLCLDIGFGPWAKNSSLFFNTIQDARLVETVNLKTGCLKQYCFKPRRWIATRLSRLYMYDWAWFLTCALVSDSRLGLCCIKTKFNIKIIYAKPHAWENPFTDQTGGTKFGKVAQHFWIFMKIIDFWWISLLYVGSLAYWTYWLLELHWLELRML